MIRFRLLFVLFFLMNTVVNAQGLRHQMVVKSEKGLSQHAPVWSDIPDGLKNVTKLHLTMVSNGQAIPVQLSEDGQRFVFNLPNSIAAGNSATFEISKTETEPTANVHAVQAEGQLILKLGKKKVLTYHTQVVEPPEGHSELYRRSGHIHPFLTPSGKVVTDGFPLDHMHQHAIFAAWTKTFFEGERVDFWNQKAGTGTVFHKEVLELKSGPVFASFKVRLAHTVLKETPQPVLDEIWTVRLYKHPEVHLFDVESVQTCVAETPLTIAEYHYGGFAFRGSAEWEGKEKHQIITNETKDRITGNHTRPNWVSIFGKVKGEVCGAAMFSHPTNFRSPQPTRLHPSMPYFVYSPSVLGEFDLKPGVPFHTKNRFIAYDGPANQQQLDALWADYSQQPEIIWKEVR